MTFLILMVIGFCFYGVMKIRGMEVQISKFEARVRELEEQLRRLHVKIVNQLTGTKDEEKVQPPEVDLKTFKATAERPKPMTPPTVVPPPQPALPQKPLEVKRPVVYPVPQVAQPARVSQPAPARHELPAIDWEQFMGVKLFAWLGGFALFLGMAFFVKYSLEHNMISPLMRVTIGFLIGVGSIIGGLSLRKKGYDVTVHTLCAAGISVLYADTFACRSFYNFLSPEVAFGLMIMITVTSFLLAVRLDSRYVAILGLVGGFLTPPMMSTGVDHPMALFAYILLLDMGLAAVTIRQHWGFLLGLSSVATFVMEVGWTIKFFTPEKVVLAMGIYVVFGLFFMLVSMIADQQEVKDKAFQEPADAMPLLSMGFAGYLLSFPDLGRHPAVIFTLIFSMLVLLGWRAIRRAESQRPYGLGTLISFLLLSVWTLKYMTPDMAIMTAGLYLALCTFTYLVSSRTKGRGTSLPTVEGVADFMPLCTFALVSYFITVPELGAHPFLIFALIFILSALLASRTVYGKGSPFAYGLGVMAGFLALAFWTASYLKPEGALLAAGIYLAYCFFHLFVSRVSDRRNIQDDFVHSPADFLPLASMAFVAYMLHFPSLGHRPGIVLTVLLILGGLSAYRALKRTEARVAYGLSGAVSFFLLSYWTVNYMRSNLLLWGLGYYMAFAAVHTLYPILFQRVRSSTKPLLAGFLAPMLGLVLILVAMLACDLLSFLLWPFVLLLGMLGVALAWLAGSLLAAGGTVFLVMACFAVWLFRLPDPAGLGGVLLLLAVFAGAFFAWSLLVTKGKSLFEGNTFLSRAGTISPEEAAQLPAFTAMMPFCLLMMVCLRLPLPNPTDVFLLALFLNVLLLALARYRRMELLVPVALVSTASLEFIWLMRNTPLAQPMIALAWSLVFYALFVFFPFIVKRHLRGMSAWISSSIAGLLQWPLVWAVTDRILGHSCMALVPAFFALPSLGCLVAAVVEEKEDRRVSKLAWFGGIALLFITLIIPIQFDKEWLTVGWTLEGAALLWLYLRVPHEGLRAWGLALLGVGFARLALNPAVFSYHPRTGIPILNWYLWVYGISAISYYAAAWLMRSKRFFLEVDMPPLLNAAGTLLAFLLLNIEIADYFSSGGVITFNFSGNLAQDMAYSLSWGLFSILLLVAGIRQASRGARYSSIGLLTLTLGKLFLHDLWRLGGLYRVASFIGLAVVLILVSFLYQKFLGKEEKAEVRHE